MSRRNTYISIDDVDDNIFTTDRVYLFKIFARRTYGDRQWNYLAHWRHNNSLVTTNDVHSKQKSLNIFNGDSFHCFFIRLQQNDAMQH